MIRVKEKDLKKLTRHQNRGHLCRDKKKFLESEKSFQQRVIELARLRGWRVAHCQKVRVQRPNGSCYYVTPMAKGWPDLVCVRGDRLLFIELKRSGEKPTPEQHDWRFALEAAGQEYYVFWPEPWAAIAKALG